MFLFNLDWLPLLLSGFPKAGCVLLLIPLQCWQGILYLQPLYLPAISQAPFTEQVLWSGWFRKQNITTTRICLCLLQSWVSSASLTCFSLHLTFNAFFSSCSALSLTKLSRRHSERKPKHNVDVVGILYHNQWKEIYSATKSGNWQKKNWINMHLCPQIFPQECSEKQII